ncbi:MAG: hypothetical protein V7707_12805 [Motiliproteus sp.]
MIENLAVWGMRWARGQLLDEELDVELLMWDIQRRLQFDKLPDGETIFCFIFNDIERYNTWWLVVRDNSVDLCTESPGANVDLYIRSSIRTMIEIWEGDLTLQSALRDERVLTQGNKNLSKTMPDWLGINPYSDVRPGDSKLTEVAASD